MMTETKKFITWCSIDPVLCKVDIYPKSMSNLIEKSYNERDKDITSECFLGKEFFSATVYFHHLGFFYQTTPGVSIDRYRSKGPGYRSVKRICVNDPEDIINIYSKKVAGEWRLANGVEDSETCFSEKIDRSLWIEKTEDLSNEISITIWKPDDFENEDLYKDVIVWQWCCGLEENQGDVIRLSDEWWIPYNYENTESIENAFKDGLSDIKIELPVIGSRNIEFVSDSCYAKQISDDRERVRVVRRVVKTVQQIKYLFDNISIPIDSVLSNLPDGTIPHHFNCPILQDIMRDPVKTIDNHVYDRNAIQRWFIDHNTSPLTGLFLSSKALTPHHELKKEIDEFLKRLSIVPSSA